MQTTWFLLAIIYRDREATWGSTVDMEALSGEMVSAHFVFQWFKIAGKLSLSHLVVPKLHLWPWEVG